jgi:prepilin-type N-terminal cleavage/methylation domain-containing protein
VAVKLLPVIRGNQKHSETATILLKPDRHMRPLSRRHSTVGFTLIELMVVMLLISIVMAVAIPRFMSGTLQDPVKKTSRWLIDTARILRSTAIKQQKRFSLVVDLSDNRFWTVDEQMDEETLIEAKEKSFDLPKDLRIIAVLFPDKERINSGTAEINFYPAGYSDRVLIDMEKDDALRFSYLFEPLLPRVKLFDRWMTF